MFNEVNLNSLNTKNIYEDTSLNSYVNEEELNVLEEVVGFKVAPMFVRIRNGEVLKLSPGFIVEENILKEFD